MIKRLNSNITIADPTQLERWLIHNDYGMQRDIKPKWLAELKFLIDNNRIVTGRVVMAVARHEHSKKYMMDGQHWSTAGKELQKSLPTLYEEYECSSEAELAELYRRFNPLPRAIKNQLEQEAEVLNIQWPYRLVNLIWAAGNAITHRRQICVQLRIPYLRDYKAVGDTIAEILAPTGKFLKHIDHLLWEPPMEGLERIYSVDGSNYLNLFIQFLKEVACGEGLNSESASYILREYLKAEYGNGHSAYGPKGREVTAKTITAWNAFKHGRKTNLKYYPDKPIPEVK